MGGPAEAEGLQEGGVTGEAGADAGWLVGVGTEADDLASHLTVSQKNIMVKLNKASPVTFVAFGVYFQGFAFVDQEAEHLVEDVAEVAVADRCDRVGCVPDDVVVMAHDVEVAEPCHLAIYGLEVTSIRLLPVFAFIVSSVVRIGLFDIVDRSQNLVETALFQNLSDLLMALFVHAYFDAFQNVQSVAYK